jgi:hypothetical protein
LASICGILDQYAGQTKTLATPLLRRARDGSAQKTPPVCRIGHSRFVLGMSHMTTRKNWAGWFGTLDRAGAEKLERAALAEIVSQQHGIPGWWSQTITVEYERARSTRQRRTRPGGAPRARVGGQGGGEDPDRSGRDQAGGRAGKETS